MKEDLILRIFLKLEESINMKYKQANTVSQKSIPANQLLTKQIVKANESSF